jgi:hypothetical protein
VAKTKLSPIKKPRRGLTFGAVFVFLQKEENYLRSDLLMVASALCLTFAGAGASAHWPAVLPSHVG